MKKSQGFKRLKGLASISAMGFAGAFSAGSARASAVSTGFSVSTINAAWLDFGNNTSFPSGTTVTTTNGNVFTATSSTTGDPAFCYTDASTNDQGSIHSDAFDCAMILAVDGNLFVNPDTTVDLTGNTVTSDVVEIVPGIDAHIQYNIFSNNRKLIRGLFTLTNTGPDLISIDAAILGDYGSDFNTTVLATSDNDLIIEASDLWYITDDNGTDPLITTTRYGVNAEVVPFNALTPVADGAVYGLRYPLDIPAGATVRIMTFHQLGPNPNQLPDQVNDAKNLESMTALDQAGLIDDLDQSVRDSIVNYGDSDIIFKDGFGVSGL